MCFRHLFSDDAGRVRVRHAGQPRVLPHLPARGPPCGRGVLRTGTHHPGAGDGWGTSHRLPHRYRQTVAMLISPDVPRPDRTEPCQGECMIESSVAFTPCVCWYGGVWLQAMLLRPAPRTRLWPSSTTSHRPPSVRHTQLHVMYRI